MIPDKEVLEVHRPGPSVVSYPGAGDFRKLTLCLEYLALYFLKSQQSVNGLSLQATVHSPATPFCYFPIGIQKSLLSFSIGSGFHSLPPLKPSKNTPDFDFLAVHATSPPMASNWALLFFFFALA